MPSRDAALAALYNRLAAGKADPMLLLTSDALRDAAELAASTDTTTDLSAAQALGWFHWHRHLSLPDHRPYHKYCRPVTNKSANFLPCPSIPLVLRCTSMASSGAGSCHLLDIHLPGRAVAAASRPRMPAAEPSR